MGFDQRYPISIEKHMVMLGDVMYLDTNMRLLDLKEHVICEVDPVK